MAKFIFRDQIVTNGQIIQFSSLSGLQSSYAIIPGIAIHNVSVGNANVSKKRSTYFTIGLSGAPISGSVECDIEIDENLPSEYSRGMTLTDMIDEFLLHVGNPGEALFSPPKVTKILNDTIKRLMNRLLAYYFPELEVFLNSVTVDANGDYDITNFEFSPFGGVLGLARWITGVRIVDGRYCEYLSDLERKYNIKDSSSYVYLASDPKWYDKSDTTLHIEPFDASATNLDFHYQKNPFMMLMPNSGNNVNCNLDPKWHSIITGLACEMYINGYTLDGKTVKAPQAEPAYNQALKDVSDIKKFMPDRNIDALDLGFRTVNGPGGLTDIYTRSRV